MEVVAGVDCCGPLGALFHSSLVILPGGVASVQLVCAGVSFQSLCWGEEDNAELRNSMN